MRPSFNLTIEVVAFPSSVCVCVWGGGGGGLVGYLPSCMTTPTS